MSGLTLEHPADEVLTEFALTGENEGVEDHCQECPSCSRYVREIRDVRDALVSLPDEDVPPSLREKVLKSASRSKGVPWFAFSTLHLFRNPFAVGIGVVLLIIFFYIFFVFVL
jgi:hypothetical protein